MYNVSSPLSQTIIITVDQKNLFKKAAVWTDIHFGKSHNSIQHNSDCIDFTAWAIKTAKENDCETCLFLGDYFDSRASVNVNTLKYGIEAMRMMNDNFDQVYSIVGNHDSYYRDSIEVTSMEFSRELKNVRLIDSIFTEGNVSIVPWLVGDDYKKIPKLNSKYIFGHFELPSFFMNAMIRMPETNTITPKHLSKPDYVFSGHFHKRQQQGNIIYIGNCFPHSYSDSWDDERGMMILEWDNKPDFISWPNAPKYRTIKLSELIADPSHYFSDKMYMRITIDVDISYEEANFIKETFTRQYDLRELSLIPQKDKHSVEENYEDTGEVKFESVDTIITNEILNIESEFYKTDKLLDIYNSL